MNNKTHHNFFPSLMHCQRECAKMRKKGIKCAFKKNDDFTVDEWGRESEWIAAMAMLIIINKIETLIET